MADAGRGRPAWERQGRDSTVVGRELARWPAGREGHDAMKRRTGMVALAGREGQRDEEADWHGGAVVDRWHGGGGVQCWCCGEERATEERK
jgi:hypothetical protein